LRETLRRSASRLFPGLDRVAQCHEGNSTRDQTLCPSLGLHCDRTLHLEKKEEPTTGNYAIGLRGCESGADQVDQHLDREPVRISTGLTLLSLRSPGLKAGPHRLDDGLDRLRREWKPPKHRAAVGSGAAKNPRGAVRL